LSLSSGCAVSFLADASDFSKLSAKDRSGNCPAGKTCEATGTFRGTALLGFGVYCDDPDLSARSSEQDQGALFPATVTGAAFTITGKEEETQPEQPVQPVPVDCGFFGISCVLQNFILFLLHLFNLG